MKTLFQYLKPYQWLIVLSLVLATINQVFSLFAPAITGKILDELVTHPNFFDKAQKLPRTLSEYFNGNSEYHGVYHFLGLLIGTAMVSRIAKAFQDYVVNVITQKYGAKIFTDGLKHSMALPFQEFEDQRSGETLSILTKVREDTVKFINSFINIFFGILVSIIFVSVYAIRLHWSIMPVYIVGIFLIAFVTNLLSKKIKTIQKNIVSE